MDKTREDQCLDNIHDIATWVFARVEDREISKAVNDIIAISRHKRPALPFLDMNKYRQDEDEI